MKKNYINHSKLIFNHYSLLIILINLLILLVIFIPQGNINIEHLYSFNFFGHYIHFIEIVYLILICYWLALLLTKKIRIIRSNLNILIIILFLYLIISLFIGFLNSNTLKNILYDLRTLIYFGLFFVIMSVVKTSEWSKTLLILVIIGTLAYSINNIIIILLNKSDNSISILERTFFRNNFLFILTIPLLICLLYYKKFNFFTFLSIIIFIPLMIHLAIGQSRLVWLSTIVNILFMFLLIFWFNKTKLKFFTKKMFSLFFIILIEVLFSFFSIIILSESLISNIINRFTSITNILNATTYRLRLLDISYAIGIFRKSPAFGSGLGATFLTHTEYIEGSYIDNSYITLLVKTGVVGIFIFFLILIYVALKITYIVKNIELVTYTYSRVLIITLISCIPGFLIATFFSAFFTHNRLIIIFIVIIAMIEIIANEIINSKKLSKNY